MLIRSSLAVVVTSLHGGAAISMPQEPALVASLRERFPRAQWGAGTRSWHVPGKLATARANLWAEEQTELLQRLEAALRDREWEAASQVTPQAAPPSRRRRIAWWAIPGQPTRDGTMPTTEPARTFAALQSLSDRLVARVAFGFLKPAPLGWRYWTPEMRASGGDRPWPPRIDIWCGRSLAPGDRDAISISWMWGALFGGDDWQREGWHPSSQILALHRPTVLCAAVNPDVSMYLSPGSFYRPSPTKRAARRTMT